MEAVACMSPKTLTSDFSIRLFSKKSKENKNRLVAVFELNQVRLDCRDLFGLIEFRVNGPGKARSFGFMVPILLERRPPVVCGHYR